MAKYILADNQEITRFAIDSLLKQDEDKQIYRASDKTSLVEQLKAHENAIVVLVPSLIVESVVLPPRIPLTKTPRCFL